MSTRRAPLKAMAPIVVASLALGVLWAAQPGRSESTEPGPRSRGVLLASSVTLPEGRSRDIAVLATNRRALRRTWRQFGLEGAPMLVDFDRRYVLFAGTGESGTCPLEYKDFDTEGRLVRLRLFAAWAQRACTDDFRPRTFVIGANKRNFPNGEFRVKIGLGKKVKVKRR